MVRLVSLLIEASVRLKLWIYRGGLAMKHLRATIAAVMVIVLLGLPELACSQRVIYVVCRKYVAQENCHKCSDYFAVQTEDEAVRKCEKRGYTDFAEPNYFPSLGRVAAWILSHCTCGDGESD